MLQLWSKNAVIYNLDVETYQDSKGDSLFLAEANVAMDDVPKYFGKGDDLTLKDRDTIRTPIQWSAEPSGGFSTADRARMIRPVVSDGDFAFTKVNAAYDVRKSPTETIAMEPYGYRCDPFRVCRSETEAYVECALSKLRSDLA